MIACSSKTKRWLNVPIESIIAHDFRVGDKVLLATKLLTLENGSGMRKLNPLFCGPFRIIQKIADVTFRLELSEPMRARNIHDSFH